MLLTKPLVKTKKYLSFLKQRGFILSILILGIFTFYTLKINSSIKAVTMDYQQLTIKNFDRAYPSTVNSKRSGSFSETSTWGGKVPGPNDNVLIKSGHIVTVDKDQKIDIKSLKVEGTLSIEQPQSTSLDTLAILIHGKLNVGTVNKPFNGNFRFSIKKQIGPQSPKPTGIFVNGTLFINSQFAKVAQPEDQIFEYLNNQTRQVSFLSENGGEINLLKKGVLQVDGASFVNLADSRTKTPANLFIIENTQSKSLIKNSYFKTKQGAALYLEKSSDMEFSNNIFECEEGICINFSTGKETNNEFKDNLVVSLNQADSGLVYHNPYNHLTNNKFQGFKSGLRLELIDTTQILPNNEGVNPFQYPFGKTDNNVFIDNNIGFYVGHPNQEAYRYKPSETLLIKNLAFINNKIGFKAAFEGGVFESFLFRDNEIALDFNSSATTVSQSSFVTHSPNLKEKNIYGVLLKGSDNKFTDLNFENYTSGQSAAYTITDDKATYLNPTNQVKSNTFVNSREFYFPPKQMPVAIEFEDKFAANNWALLSSKCEDKLNWNGRLCEGKPVQINILNGSTSELKIIRLDTNVSDTLIQNEYNKQSIFKFIGVAKNTYQLISGNQNGFSINYLSHFPVDIKFAFESSPKVLLNNQIYAPFSDGEENWIYDETKKEVTLHLRFTGDYQIQTY